MDLPLRRAHREARATRPTSSWRTERARPRPVCSRRLTGWGRYHIGDTFAAANDGLKGRRVDDIADERGATPSTRCSTSWSTTSSRTVLWPGADRRRRRVLAHARRGAGHPDVIIGGSDAGAHLDRMCGAPYTTAFLADCLRGRQLVAASRRPSATSPRCRPRCSGCVDAAGSPRGGSPTSSCSTPTPSARPVVLGQRPARRQPTALRRADRHREGVRQRPPHRRRRQPTGELPGTVLRSGRDTRTVPLTASNAGCSSSR